MLISLTGNWVGFAALVIFVVAYLLVAIEEYTHLRKAKPMITAVPPITLYADRC